MARARSGQPSPGPKLATRVLAYRQQHRPHPSRPAWEVMTRTFSPWELEDAVIEESSDVFTHR